MLKAWRGRLSDVGAVVLVLIAIETLVACSPFASSETSPEGVATPDGGASSDATPDGGASSDATTSEAEASVPSCAPSPTCQAPVELLHASDFTSGPAAGSATVDLGDDGVCGGARFIATGDGSSYNVQVRPVTFTVPSTIHIRQQITGPEPTNDSASIGCGVFVKGASGNITEVWLGVAERKFKIDGHTTEGDGFKRLDDPPGMAFAVSPAKNATHVVVLSATITNDVIKTAASIGDERRVGPDLQHPGGQVSAEVRCGVIHQDGAMHSVTFERIELQVCPGP